MAGGQDVCCILALIIKWGYLLQLWPGWWWHYLPAYLLSPWPGPVLPCAPWCPCPRHVSYLAPPRAMKTCQLDITHWQFNSRQFSLWLGIQSSGHPRAIYIFSLSFGKMAFNAFHWPENVSWPSHWLMISPPARKYRQWSSLGQGGMCEVILPLTPLLLKHYLRTSLIPGHIFDSWHFCQF